MRTLAFATAFTRKMIGRRAVYTMMAGFNQSAINTDESTRV